MVPLQAVHDKTNTIFSYRARLNLDTSFTGKDLLRTRLQASNTPNIGTALSAFMAQLTVAVYPTKVAHLQVYLKSTACSIASQLAITLQLMLHQLAPLKMFLAH